MHIVLIRKIQEYILKLIKTIKMNKNLLQQIKNLSLFIFTDEGYENFIMRIRIKDYNVCRLILDSRLDKIEMKLNLDFENEELLLEYKNVDKLLDLVIELIIVNDRKRCRRKQIREIAK